MQRRYFMQTAASGVSGFLTAAYAQKSLGKTTSSKGGQPSNLVLQGLKRLEAGSGGRLGVALLDTASGTMHGYRAGERFPMCSTVKLLICALVLKRVDYGEESLVRHIRFSARDLIAHSPFTQPGVGGNGMSIRALCEAAMTVGDNTAANLLLGSFGGPRQLTAYTRHLGDKVTRLDRMEPDLNQALPGDVRDTTTPSAMLANMNQIILGSALSDASRSLMRQWLLDNKTGEHRLRAGLPAGWRAGDRTGSSTNGVTNDLAVVWPPGRAPFLVAAYLAGNGRSAEQREATLAKVGELVASLVGPAR